MLKIKQEYKVYVIMYDYEKEKITNLAVLLPSKAEKNNDKIAVVHLDRKISYRELDYNSSRIATGLSKLGVSKGDKVALFMRNSIEFLYCWFGVVKLGAVLVPLNIALKGDLLRYQINDSDAKVVITENALLESYIDVKPHLDKVKSHVLLGKEENGFIQYETLLDNEPLRNLAEVKHSDPAVIIYTSGTTGPPKGVVLPHYAYINTALMNSRIAEAREGDIFYSTVPFFHTSGQLQVILPALINDLTAAFDDWFHASTFWKNVRKYNASVIFLISSMINILLKQPPNPDEKSHRVRIAMTGGAKRELWVEFEKRFGVKVLEGYGMTETCAIAAFNRGEEVRVGSVGKILPYFEAKVVDEYDNEVPPYTKGELVIRPKIPFTMMLEYYKKPEKTVEAWRNLWFHTGDIFYMDEDGFLYFVERKKDIIRRRGENISPYDIESVVNKHPAILEAVAVGVPSELGEEEIKLYIKLKEGEKLDYMDFLKWCEKELPYYMIPRYIEIIEEVPKTATQRPKRYLLKERGVGNAFDAYAAGFRPRKTFIKKPT